jgi:hypothetical protein
MGRWISGRSRAAWLIASLANALMKGDLYVMIQCILEPVLFRVQEGAAGEWKRLIDTSRPSPEDIVELGNEELLDSLNYKLAPRSIALLVRQPSMQYERIRDE